MCEREMNEMANHKNARKLLRPKIKSEPEKQREHTQSKYQLRPGLIDNKRINTIKTKRNTTVGQEYSLCVCVCVFVYFARQIQKMNRFLCVAPSLCVSNASLNCKRP